mmetsp:Transcript_11254/g.14894  ORF Transcript_11254/g.14894 Transcript_11254/m.14894 type:complete len:218 (+) Transcript_11254:1272-1925(+)
MSYILTQCLLSLIHFVAQVFIGCVVRFWIFFFRKEKSCVTQLNFAILVTFFVVPVDVIHYGDAESPGVNVSGNRGAMGLSKLPRHVTSPAVEADKFPVEVKEAASDTTVAATRVVGDVSLLINRTAGAGFRRVHPERSVLVVTKAVYTALCPLPVTFMEMKLELFVHVESQRGEVERWVKVGLQATGKSVQFRKNRLVRMWWFGVVFFFFEARERSP